MLLKLLASALRKRNEKPAEPKYTGVRHAGFVAFVVDVNEPHFIARGDHITADQASLRLRAWLPALELTAHAPVCFVPLHHVERDPELLELGEVRAIVLGKFSVQRIIAEPARFAALAAWLEGMAVKHLV